MEYHDKSPDRQITPPVLWKGSLVAVWPCVRKYAKTYLVARSRRGQSLSRQQLTTPHPGGKKREKVREKKPQGAYRGRKKEFVDHYVHKPDGGWKPMPWTFPDATLVGLERKTGGGRVNGL